MLFSPVFVTLHSDLPLPPREPHCPASARRIALWAISTEPNLPAVTQQFPFRNAIRDSQHSHYAQVLSFHILTHSFAVFLHLRKTQLFYFQAIPHSLPKTPGWGYPSHQKAGRSLASAILSSPEDPLLEVAKSILLILTGPFPIVNPLRRSSRVFRPHARVILILCAASCAACRPEQFYSC